MEDILNFTQKDFQLFDAKSIAVENVQEQIKLFEKGAVFTELNRACTPNDGIVTINNEQAANYIANYSQKIQHKKVMKFVPASGAASRMFKHFHTYKNGDESELVDQFIANLQAFAFYPFLENVLVKSGLDINSLIKKGDYETLFKYLLSDLGLNYGNLPKAMIEFHDYDDISRKAIEEHFVEGAKYADNSGGKVHLHFTVSENHLEIIQKYVNQIIGRYEFEYQVNYDITYSTQHPSTDTIAVDLENNPFRKSNGELLFRPGGHGALLDNLQELDADIIFIKNIDNVVKEDHQVATYASKKTLGGVLIELQESIHSYLKLDKKEAEKEKTSMLSFLKEKLGVDLSQSISTDDLQSWLNRPIRVCGMVKNEGEPGGGPFWVNTKNGLSPQIVESAQIDKSNSEQLSIMKNSTHFNPVDLVCSTKDYKGNKFDLKAFRDMSTVFISSKSLEGRDLKALELPGLWNGAMAEWITVFVEVPLITFNPVKTVNDLLKKNHM